MSRKTQRRRKWANSLQIPVNLQLRESSDDGPPSFRMSAYNGGVIHVDAFDDAAIINVAGISIPNKRRVVMRMEHSDAPDDVVGHGQATKRGGSLMVRGKISAATPASERVVASSKNGFPWQASVGLSFDRRSVHELRKGETAEVNGATVQGPLSIVQSSVLREVSFVANGADASTEVDIAASAVSPRELKDMTFQEWLEARKIDAESLTAAQLDTLERDFTKMQLSEVTTSTATVEEGDDVSSEDTGDDDTTASAKLRLKAAENYRQLAMVEAHLRNYPEEAAQAIEEGWTEPEIKLAALRASRSKGPAIHSRGGGWVDVSAGAKEVALLRACGVTRSGVDTTGQKYGVEEWYDERTLSAADHPQLRNISLSQMLDCAIIQATGSSYSGARNTDAFISACQDAMLKLRAQGSHQMMTASGVSTLEVSGIFSNVAQKILMDAYAAQRTTWEQWCRIIPTRDFKQVQISQLEYHGALQQVPPGGDLTHGKFAETQYSAQAQTFGKIYGLDRHHIINDDLMAFSSLMSGLGTEAARSIEENAWVAFLAARDTLFPDTDANGNYIAGATSNVSLEAYEQALTKFGNQVGGDGAPIGIEPDRVLVSYDNTAGAEDLFARSEIREGRGSSRGTSVFTSNRYRARFMPITSPYPASTALKQRVNNAGAAIPNQLATQWWMVANPNNPSGALMFMALLNGNRTPVVQQSDADFKQLGLQYRAYYDFQASTGDPKFGVYSKGAA